MAEGSINYLEAMGGIADPIAAINQAAMAGLQQQQMRDQHQANILALGQAQQQQTRQQMFQADAQRVMSNPNDVQGYSDLMLRYPEFRESISGAFSQMDKAKKTETIRNVSSVFFPGLRGDYATSARILKQRIEADTAAGRADPHDAEILAELESGDPKRQRAAIGLIGAPLYAADPEHFAGAVQAITKDQDGFSLSQGQTRFDADGKPIASVAPEQRYLVVPEGGSAIPIGPSGMGVAIQPGGGGQTSGGGAIPFNNLVRQESGGNHFGSDGKITTSPKGALGIAQVMPGTAKEAARLAGLPWDPNRYRNDPEYNHAIGEAYYNEQRRTFGRDDLAAAAYNAGPGRVKQALRGAKNTGRDWKTFLPAETRDYLARVSGGAQTASGGVIQGRPKQKTQVLSPQEAGALGLDPKVVYQRSPEGTITAVSGQKPNPGLPKVPAATMQAFVGNRASLGKIDGAIAAIDKYPNGLGYGNRLIPDAVVQRTDPNGVDVRSKVADIGSLLIHDRSGAAVTISETPRLLPFVPQVWDTPDAAKKKLRNLRAALASQNQDFIDAYSNEDGDSQLLRIGKGRAKQADAPAAPKFKIIATRRPK